MRKILSLFLLSVAVFISCEHDMETNVSYVDKLELETHVLRLSDDSTGIAGRLAVLANTSEIKLKWNVPPTCNIDTTVTSLHLHNGSAELLVKWNKCLSDSSYSPMDKAFDAGVLISSGDISEYVHLIWADQVDSTMITKMEDSMLTKTRADGEMPPAIVLTLYPEIVPMDILVGGGIYVDYSGIPLVTVDQTDIPISTNIDKVSIPRFLSKPGEVIFNWTTAGAPDINFTSFITFTAGSIRKQATLVYNRPNDEPSYWVFVNSTPDSGSPIPAIDASIVVTAKTNKDWSIESDNAIISPVRDNGGTPLGNKTLNISITDNPNPAPRTITVLVKSEGVVKETLTFTQPGTGGGETGTVFNFISSNPANNATLPAAENILTVKVNTDYAWWIDLDGTRTSLPAGALGDKTGVIAIPANMGTTNKTITVTVGHGTTTEKTLTFTQTGIGGGDMETLDYVSSNLPAGNIPAEGGTYTFTFNGTYTGNVQMRILLDGVAQAPGSAVTNKQPQVNVPLNAGVPRAITFQYKRDDRDWTNLPVSTDRRQDGNGGVVPGDKPSHTGVTPEDVIPDAGGDYSTTFFNYAGEVFFRAVSGKGRLLAHTSITVAAGGSTKATLLIPEARSLSDNMVIFQFSTDDANWTDIETRRQIVETFASGSFNDMPMTIPASGGTYHYSTTGTLSAVLTVVAKDENNVVLVESKGKAGTPIPVVIPANKTGRSRSIFFWYMRGDQPGRYNYIKRADQAGI